MIDLNSYFILVMNRDNTIAVIDPITGVKGITKLYAQVYLKEPGADWAKPGDNKRLFVTMPRADAVAVVDTDTFKVVRNVDAGKTPMRIVLQPDEKYLWVGNNGDTASESGVTVIDIDTLAVAEFIPTGRGHHEIAFSADSRYAFVSNRADGSVTVIDVNRLKKIKDIDSGPLPISLAYSVLSKALYVADGEKGEIAVIDGRSFEQVAKITAKPGLGPLRFSQDGRWAVAVNSREDVAYVIDPSTNTIAHTIAVGKQPFQVAFSRSFAYVRSLGTERVSMIDLSELGKPGTVPVVTFAAGAKAPGDGQRHQHRRCHRRGAGGGRRCGRQPGGCHRVLLHGGHERAHGQLQKLRPQAQSRAGGGPLDAGARAGGLFVHGAPPGGRHLRSGLLAGFALGAAVLRGQRPAQPHARAQGAAGGRGVPQRGPTGEGG